MPSNTTNYNLVKPAENEYYDVNVQNGNMDLIDAALTPTADPGQVPAGNGPGKLVQWVSWITNRIKAITGKTNWWDNPDTTLADAKSHIDAAAPHSGHETPAGAQAKVDALAGAGNTKTVKQLDDEITSHLADVVTDADGVHGLKIESGIFTPKFEGSITPGINTYATQIGAYYKIGNLVKFDIRLTMSAKDAAISGNLKISGLPFTAAGISGQYFSCSIGLISSIDLDTTKNILTGVILNGTNYIALYNCGDNVAHSPTTVASLTATSSLYISGEYLV